MPAEHSASMTTGVSAAACNPPPAHQAQEALQGGAGPGRPVTRLQAGAIADRELIMAFYQRFDLLDTAARSTAAGDEPMPSGFSTGATKAKAPTRRTMLSTLAAFAADVGVIKSIQATRFCWHSNHGVRHI